jgi:transcriptional regulator GlxA family with amidase domain
MNEVIFALPPNVLLLDLAGPAEAFRVAARCGASLTLRFVSAEAQVASSVGLALSGLEPLPETVPTGALVLVPGTLNDEHDVDEPAGRALVRWLAERAAPSGARLAAVCSGALFLGAAGLLAGRACTTHFSLLSTLAERTPSAQVQANRVFVSDGPVATSAGICAGIDLALFLVAELAGADLTRQVARHMVVYFRRSPADPALSPWLAYRNHLHDKVHAVQDLIAADPVRRWPLDELAERAHVSPRHLARLFREHSGITVLGYQTALRLSLAEQWRAGGLGKEKAALAAGFASAKAWRQASRLAEVVPD